MFVTTEERKIINLDYYVEVEFYHFNTEKIGEAMGYTEEEVKTLQRTEYQIRARQGQEASEYILIASFSLEQKEMAEAAFKDLFRSIKESASAWDADSFKSNYGVELHEINMRIDRQTE